jgi:hypothetical protein
MSRTIDPSTGVPGRIPSRGGDPEELSEDELRERGHLLAVQAGSDARGGEAFDMQTAKALGQIPPVGTWRMDPVLGYLEQLQRVPVDELTFTESTEDRGIRRSVEKYVGYYEAGLQPPPAEVVWNVPTQKLVTLNRRRVLAAKEAGVQSILAWVGGDTYENMLARQARRNPSPTKTLYRAAHDATVTAGTCFAEDIDDAIEYQDNPGFGGPNLYSLEVTPTYKTFVESLEDARDQIADAIMTHGWPSGVRRPRGLDDEVELTKEDLVAWLEDVFSGYESGHAHVHDVVADTPWVVDLLGQSYDWVVFKDSFPEDCITWCYVGDDDLEDGMSLIDAQ